MSDATERRIGPWTATPSLNLLQRDDHAVKLEPRAMDVLVVLARHGGAVVSIDALIADAWDGVAVTDGSVYLAIRQLRQALATGDDGVRSIETIPKRGYRLLVPVVLRDSERQDPPTPPESPPAARLSGPEPQPHRWRLWASVAGVTAIATCLAIVPFRHDVESAAIRSVAVLPFDNVSSGPGQDVFADGISAELLNALARVHGLKVASRTASLRFTGVDTDLQTIGEALDVEHVLHGSVRTAGTRVRITVQLSRARNGERLWSDTYERSLDDIFLIQDDIARSVANALQVRLGIGEIGRAPGMTRNVAAYEEYLRARSQNLEWTPESFRLAVGHLQRAVALDPSFSIAWARLSTIYLNGTFIVRDRADEWRAKAAAALEQARTLTPDAPDVLLEIGVTEARRRNWIGAARAFDRLKASYARHGLTDRAWGPRGILMLAVGRPGEAIAALERARADEPHEPGFARFLSAAYLADGDITAAAAEIDRGLRLHGLETLLLREGVLAALNRRDRGEIAARVEMIPDASPDAAVHRRLMTFFDAPHEGAAQVRLFASATSAADKALLAQWAAFFDDPELSLQLLTDAAPHLNHPGRLWQPLFRDVRQRPGFKDVVRTMGLVDYWRESGWPDFCQPVGDADFVCR